MKKHSFIGAVFLLTFFCCFYSSQSVSAEESNTIYEETTDFIVKEIESDNSKSIENQSTNRETVSSENKKELKTTESTDDSLIDINAGKEVPVKQQKVYKKNWDVWNKPYEEGARSLTKSTDFYQKIVVISREATKGNTIYVLINEKVGNEILPIGWINQNGVDDVELGDEVRPYEQRVSKRNWTIWDRPYVFNAESVENTTNFFDKIVTVTREATSNNVDYAFIQNKIGDHLTPIGWVNKNGLTSIDPLYSKEGALVPNTYKYVTRNNWDIWNEPYTSTSKSVKNTKEYFNEKILLTRRAKTPSGIYIKMWVYREGGYKYVGWLNESALSNSIPDINQMSGELIPNTYGEVIRNSWTIWERPYKPGTSAIADTSSYKNQKLLFTRRSKTNYGTYYKMWAKKNNNYKYVGWIKDTGTTLIDKVEYKKSISKPMMRVSKKEWTLWDRPYVYGAKSKGISTSYYGSNVQISSEAKTNYGLYYEIKHYGKKIGWISSSGLSNLGDEIIVPLIQANQINTAGYAPSGCAACSAYTVLHSKNKAMDKNLTWFYNNLPQHPTNPDLGQIGDPWKYYDFRAVISPVGLNNFMRSLGGNSQNITGQSMSYVKNELKLGNPVLFWGRVGLSDVSNSLTTHVMIFMGYKNGYYLVQDPAYTGSNNRRWFSESRVRDYMQIKGKKMVVVR